MGTDTSGQDKPGQETGQLNEQLGVTGGNKRPPATSGDTRRSTRRGDDGSTP